MTSASRLRVTSVRYAHPADRAHLSSAIAALSDGLPIASVLVVGTPTAGFAVVVDDAGSLRLAGVRVSAEVAGLGVEEMLIRAALGLMLDAGQKHVAVTATADADPVIRTVVAGMPVPDPLADSPVAILAVSVIPVREVAGRLEVFVQYRVSTMDFAAGAVVFPGGRIDPGDRQAGAALALPATLVAEHGARWGRTAYGHLGSAEEAARTLLATGIREVAEETGAVLDPARLVPWDDWITPIGMPKRFDVRFFLYPVEAAETASFGHTTTEAHRSGWAGVSTLVDRTEARELVLLPPTRTILDELSALGSVAGALSLTPVLRPVRHDIAARRPRR